MAKSFHYTRPIVGYHGCDQSTVESVLLHGARLVPSNNNYDWLGRGVYFWEHGPRRALEWAQELAERHADSPPSSGMAVTQPAVLGAYVQLGRCFDLCDRDAVQALSSYYPRWLDSFGPDDKIPENRPAPNRDDHDLRLRFRDCAVINSLMDSLEQSESGFDTVRGVFVEGEPVFEGSALRTHSHVQIAVRNLECILGYFVPRLEDWDGQGNS